ncbi:MAG: nucleotide sugar dehydrogenase, partial [Flavobacteriaceae bacterium]|nr:nucleotide sugar dehydrogenase [Flavobacteriaceae bacterium]
MKDIIGVIGLGYVGLPLAVAFSKKYNIIGYDKNSSRVEELNSFKDSTGEVSSLKLKKAINSNRLNLITTPKIKKLHNASIFIVTVPTPIDHNKNPDLKPLIKASETIGKYISKNNLVIFESTVYPGTTEEVCVPVIERFSKLKFNEEFFVGYSPERINPGDKKRTIDKIIKITSGSNEKTAIRVDNLYKEIIKAGTYLAPSIKIAEAAKVIENSQRDINIAFMNELSKIFNLLNIDTKEVLKAASTKWNFLDFQPGLVGGHCIGVDPYYLAYKSMNVGYKPEIILSGRTINDSMPIFIYNQINKLLKQKKINKTSLKILILGFTFK